MKFTISDLQKALQSLGFLHLTHAADGDWDLHTGNAYMMACSAANIPQAQQQQPQHFEQLPASLQEALAGGTGASDSAAEEKAAADAKAAEDAAAAKAAEEQAAAKVEADAAAVAADKATDAPKSDFNLQGKK